MVAEGKVKVSKVQEPTSLTTVEFLSYHEVLKVLVVHSNFHWISCSFKKMSPLFQGPDDSQHFLVVDLIILFHWG